MTATQTERASLRFGSALLNELKRRVSLMCPSIGRVVRRDLERYYEVLSRSCPTLPLVEAELLADIFEELSKDTYTILLAQKFFLLHPLVIKNEQLSARLQGFTYSEWSALIDALEQVRWADPTRERSIWLQQIGVVQ